MSRFRSRIATINTARSSVRVRTTSDISEVVLPFVRAAVGKSIREHPDKIAVSAGVNLINTLMAELSRPDCVESLRTALCDS